MIKTWCFLLLFLHVFFVCSYISVLFHFLCPFPEKVYITNLCSCSLSSCICRCGGIPVTCQHFIVFMLNLFCYKLEGLPFFILCGYCDRPCISVSTFCHKFPKFLLIVQSVCPISLCWDTATCCSFQTDWGELSEIKSEPVGMFIHAIFSHYIFLLTPVTCYFTWTLVFWLEMTWYPAQVQILKSML